MLKFLLGRKGVILSLFLSSLFISGISQTNRTPINSFVITKLADVSKLEFYKSAISKVDFEKYRSKTKSVLLEFRNGFQMELLSAEVLKQRGNVINMDEYTDILPSNYRYPSFKIDDSGIIVTQHKTGITKLEISGSKH